MPGFPEYDTYDGLGLAELVRKKEVKPAELLEEAIARTEKLNPTLNAVITPVFDQARAEVKGKLPDGPFRGVPFLLKDLHHAYAGVRMANGCEALKHCIPEDDSTLVKRFRKAGVVVFGKTNTPEFGLMGVTEPKAFGPSRNPWNPDHTPGGSSGGSGSAVAAGLSPLASASDGGGSIRIPASMCGLFGLKPTRGRTPSGPEEGLIWEGAGISHVVSRSVRDSAAMLDATCGPDIGAPLDSAVPERPFLQEVGRAPGKLRIAFSTQSPLGTDTHPEAVKAMENTVRLLKELGHTVEEATPDLDGPAVGKAYLTMYMGQVAADLRQLEREHGADARDKVEEVTRLIGNLGDALSAGAYTDSLRNWNTFARAMGNFHTRYDLFLTPTVAYPPVRVGELEFRGLKLLGAKLVNKLHAARLMIAAGILDSMAEESLSKTPFTQLANLTGQPAMSVPLHWTAEGLPLGSQFIASFGDEATLFRLAAQLEQAQPWFNRRPAMVQQLLQA